MSDWMVAADPGVYPLTLSDNGLDTRLLRLSEADYAAASFLDERLLAGKPPSSWATTSSVFDGAVLPPAPQAHFIFHLGHVGSTLLSRLLGEHPDLFSVREPALLRRAAGGELPGRLDTLVRLFARTWRPQQTALIKATSFVSEIAPDLMALARGRIVLLGVTPPVYLRTVLGGPNSRGEAASLAPARRGRLEARLGRPLQTQGEGELIAMSWLCEAAALHAAASLKPDRTLRLDFDAVLADPIGWLTACFVHLEVDPGAVELRTLVEGPLMRRYAKGPEHAYDAGLRAEVQAQAARDSAGEIRAGMDWLQREAGRDPRVTDILRAAADTARRRPLASVLPAG